MKDSVINNWDEILEVLRNDYDISKVSFKCWLEDLRCVDIKDNIVIIQTKDEKVIQDTKFVKDRYYNKILCAISDVTNESFDGIDIISDRNSSQNSHIDSATPENKNANNLGLPLDRNYTFDNFVVSSNSYMAYSAALRVAEIPGSYYNPLFIYGEPGLGKTHLMHSIANYIIDNSPSMRVMYVTSETFTNELIDAIRHGKTTPSDFREKYRNVDILLIDDIQFIIGKDSTMEEFFNTFNYLYGAKKQIVITSDKHPKEFKNLEERLKSRFECGLPVDLTYPDFEAKMAILKKKIELKNAEGNNIDIGDDVLAYIANNINSNVRYLEGALTKIIAMSKFQREPINMELAEYALRDIISPNCKKVITAEVIINIVSEHENISVPDILSKKRDKDIALARQIAMYLSRKYTSMSSTDIAAVFEKDHSTVLHAIKKVEEIIETDPLKAADINTIVKKLNIE